MKKNYVSLRSMFKNADNGTTSKYLLLETLPKEQNWRKVINLQE